MRYPTDIALLEIHPHTLCLWLLLMPILLYLAVSLSIIEVTKTKIHAFPCSSTTTAQTMRLMKFSTRSIYLWSPKGH